MVRKLSKVRSKLVGSTDISWVRIVAPRFVRPDDLAAARARLALEEKQPAYLDAGPVHRSTIVTRTGITPDPDRTP